MTVPIAYKTASDDFARYLADLREISGLATPNQCYARTRAVFHVLRRYMTPVGALRFAAALPPLLRAVFTDDWQSLEEAPPVPERTALIAEIAAVREAHNAHTDTNAIADVAAALARQMSRADLERGLEQVPDPVRRLLMPA